MIDPDVVFAKVGHIQNCLSRIKQVTHLDPATLENYDVQDIFVLNLQRAVQAAIDLAAHIVAAEGLGLPDSLKGYFKLLQQAGILSTDLTDKLVAMVGFRNIAVHHYEELDLNILKAILERHLVDLEDFYRTVLEYYRLHDT